MLTSAELLKALSDETRLRIVNLIFEKELLDKSKPKTFRAYSSVSFE